MKKKKVSASEENEVKEAIKKPDKDGENVPAGEKRKMRKGMKARDNDKDDYSNLIKHWKTQKR